MNFVKNVLFHLILVLLILKKAYSLISFPDYKGLYKTLNEHTVTALFFESFLIDSISEKSLIRCLTKCNREPSCKTVLFEKFRTCHFLKNFPNLETETCDSSETSIHIKSSKRLNESCQTNTECLNNLECKDNICKCSNEDSYWSFDNERCIQCKSGWTSYKNLNCFKYYDNWVAWLKANETCTKENSLLLTIKDSEKFHFFQNLIKESTAYCVWVGSYTLEPKKFTWFDGSEIDPSFWGPDQPDNGGQTDVLIENAVQYSQYFNYNLLDGEENKPARFICEYN